jgi:hypothetical protein
MIAVYERHSPSKLNLFVAERAMFFLEYVLGEKQLVGPPAHRGVAVEDGVTHGLNDPDASFKECTDVALVTYDNRTALSGDPRREKYRDTINGMVETALIELRPYGRPTSTQGLVEWQPEGCTLPIVGYYDYVWENHGILADLKTTEKMPGSIKFSHARQVAHYAVSDNIDARLIYVTPRKIEVFRLENVRRHREGLAKIAESVEEFLGISDDPEILKKHALPNLDSFYWISPQLRQRAYEIWEM